MKISQVPVLFYHLPPTEQTRKLFYQLLRALSITFSFFMLTFQLIDLIN